jgi:hypothetical protein
MAVYIIEFSERLHHAGYYVGMCGDKRVMERFREHCSGRGAHITRAAVERGISLTLLAVFPGFRDEELKIKQRKNTPRLVEQLRRKGVIK